VALSTLRAGHDGRAVQRAVDALQEASRARVSVVGPPADGSACTSGIDPSAYIASTTKRTFRTAVTDNAQAAVPACSERSCATADYFPYALATCPMRTANGIASAPYTGPASGRPLSLRISTVSVA